MIGVESDAKKHLMGLVNGSSENAEAVKDLLNSLIERGLATSREYLFAIGGSKALRSAIRAVFGERAHVQRCRTHEIRNVTERLPKPTRQQIASVMRAAYKLPVDEGIARLKTQAAAWLKADRRDAAAPLLEGLEETFAVNRLNPGPRLIRSLDDDEPDRESERRGTTRQRPGRPLSRTPTWRCDGRPPASWKPRSASENSAVPTISGCSPSPCIVRPINALTMI